MTTDQPDVVVLGGAAAGSAIAAELTARGKRVVLIHRSPLEGATHSNQKWLHSGLLYPTEELAQKVWKQFKEDWDLKAEFITGYKAAEKKNNADLRTAQFLFLDKGAYQTRISLLDTWKKSGKIAPFRELGDKQVTRLNNLGIRCVGGFSAPDCTVDFPRLAAKLRGQLVIDGHDVRDGSAIKLIRRGNAVVGVECEDRNRKLFTIKSKHCVVAMGAWSSQLLKNSKIELQLPVIRKKCIVLVYEGRVVDRLTCWCDISKDDNSAGDASLVPFGKETLGANNDFKVVYGELPANPGKLELALLRRELNQGLPGLKAGKPRVCIKTEHYNPDHPDVSPTVYGGRKSQGKWNHGVRGLIIALPGKASLMFDLARLVGEQIR